MKNKATSPTLTAEQKTDNKRGISDRVYVELVTALKKLKEKFPRKQEIDDKILIQLLDESNKAHLNQTNTSVDFGD